MGLHCVQPWQSQRSIANGQLSSRVSHSSQEGPASVSASGRGENTMSSSQKTRSRAVRTLPVCG
eukprot:93565-Chlamydomonas_euryale.AAC.2